MALSLAIAQPSGVVPTYWKASIIHIDTVNEVINCEIGGYLNSTTYGDGAPPIVTVLEVITGTQYTTLLASSNLVTEFYTLLSQTSYFTGSTIVS